MEDSRELLLLEWFLVTVTRGWRVYL